jgi:hypothetical protein
MKHRTPIGTKRKFCPLQAPFEPHHQTNLSNAIEAWRTNNTTFMELNKPTPTLISFWFEAMMKRRNFKYINLLLQKETHDINFRKRHIQHNR